MEKKDRGEQYYNMWSSGNRKESKYKSLSRSDVEKAVKRVDWDDIVPRLHLSAAKLHSKYLKNIQSAPEPLDFVQEAIADLLSGRRTWPQGLPLFVVLSGIVRSNVSNFLQKRREDALVDPTLLFDPSRAADIPIEILKAEIRKLVQDDKELVKLTTFLLEDPLLTPRDLAKMMAVPVKSVYNAKKRLERKLKTLRKSLR